MQVGLMENQRETNNHVVYFGLNNMIVGQIPGWLVRAPMKDRLFGESRGECGFGPVVPGVQVDGHQLGDFPVCF